MINEALARQAKHNVSSDYRKEAQQTNSTSRSDKRTHKAKRNVSRHAERLDNLLAYTGVCELDQRQERPRAGHVSL